jgi:hypothetical protein
MRAIDGAIHEGRAAYVLGSRMDANPYRKAKDSYREIIARNIRRVFDDDRYAGLTDLECQWDSGYAVAKRESRFNA